MDDVGGQGYEQQDTSHARAADDLSPAHGRGWPEPPEFSVGNAFQMGWDVLKARYGLLLGTVWLYILIVVAAGIFAGFTSLLTLLPLVDWAAQFLFYPLMWIGLIWVAVRVIRGESGGVGDLFGGFKRYWPVVGAQALVLVIVYGIVILATVTIMVSVAALGVSGAFGGSSNNAGVAVLVVSIMFIVMLVPLLVIMPRIWLAPIICLDTRQRVLGPIESFKTSWKMTGRPGVWGGQIVLVLLFMLISTVSVLLLVLPYFFVALPLGVAVAASTYWQISRQYWRGLEYECNVCSYDLRGARSGTCPECGEPIPTAKLGLI